MSYAGDWPHDPDGEEGSEGKRKYGHAVLAKKIDDEEDFPLAAADYVEEYGDHPVRISYEQVVSVEEIFENVEQESFADFVEFHQALGETMRASGYWFYEGPEQFVDA
ncbi:DUF5785 family protein [Halolamina sp.]|jgi:hypothetical protein|uniref:DUF5785 family protein n=1 Tax=Halolamina sp. TaxID=1940283 RepID=UPI000223B469|nr:hypothetical protein Halar_1567 [halophilic archaeon DL31]